MKKVIGSGAGRSVAVLPNNWPSGHQPHAIYHQPEQTDELKVLGEPTRPRKPARTQLVKQGTRTVP